MSFEQLTPKELNALSQIELGKVYADYFFKRVQDFKWFYPLKEKGYFAPGKNPAPEQVDAEGHSFRIPFWNVLDYLEALSKQQTHDDYQEIVSELIEIMRQVAQYRRDDDKIIDNFHTWRYFIRIMANIPVAEIPGDLVDKIAEWLDSRFNGMLVSGEIMKSLLPNILAGYRQDSTTDLRVMDLATRILGALTTIKMVDVPDGERWLFDTQTVRPKILGDIYSLQEAFVTGGLGREFAKLDTPAPFDLIGKKLYDIDNKKPHLIAHSILEKEYTIFVDHQGPDDLLIQLCVGTYTADGLGKGIETLAPNAIIENIRLNLCDVVPVFGIFDEFIRRFKNAWTSPDAQALVARIEDNELAALYRNIEDDYSWIWLADLHGEDITRGYDPENVLALLLKEMLIGKAIHDAEAAREQVRQLMGPKYNFHIFRRIAIVGIEAGWTQLQDVLYEILVRYSGRILFNVVAYRPEMYTLLESIAPKLDENQATIIDGIITAGPLWPIPEGGKTLERKIAEWKLYWYGALKKSSYFEEKHKDFLTQVGAEIPPSFREPKVMVGPGKSPLTVDQILLGLQNYPAEFVRYLVGYRSEDRWRGPNVNALGENLKAAVAQQPNCFTDNAAYFLDVGYLYVYQIITGLREAWGRGEDLDWGSLLQFLRAYMEREAFWDGSLKVDGDDWPTTPDWIVGMVGWLIQDGTVDDKHAIPAAHNSEITQLLIGAWDRIKSSKPQYNSDFGKPVDFTSNTTVGKLLMADINLSLRIARLKVDQNDNRRWEEEPRRIFEEALGFKYLEAITLMGWMLPQLTYLDHTWANRQIEALYSEPEQIFWKLFFYGYLFGRVAEPLNDPRMIDHYKKAISNPIPDWDTDELLAYHIANTYVFSLPSIPANELMAMFHAGWDNQRLQNVVKHFGLLHHYGLQRTDDGPHVAIDHILEFWSVLDGKYSTKDGSEGLDDSDKNTLSELAELTPYIATIDDRVKPWLVHIAPYVDRTYNSPIFVKQLNRLKDKGDPNTTARHLADIYEAMVLSFCPYYKESEIIDTIRFICSSGDEATKRKALNICDAFLKDGKLFLKATCEEFDPSRDGC